MDTPTKTNEYVCDTCNVSVKTKGKAKHLKTQMHRANVEGTKVPKKLAGKSSLIRYRQTMEQLLEMRGLQPFEELNDTQLCDIANEVDTNMRFLYEAYKKPNTLRTKVTHLSYFASPNVYDRVHKELYQMGVEAEVKEPVVAKEPEREPTRDERFQHIRKVFRTLGYNWRRSEGNAELYAQLRREIDELEAFEKAQGPMPRGELRGECCVM